MSQKLIFSLLFFVCSCQFEGTSYIFFDNITEKRVEESLAVEETQLIEQIQCKQEGKTCSEYKSCQRFCNDLFFTHKGKENCYKWSYSFFKDFEELAQQLKAFSFSHLDFPTVKCFFKMSEDHKITIFKGFTEKAAEEFLEQVAINQDLAWSLFRSDKEHFDILKDLFEKRDRRVQRAIGKDIFSDSSFLILAHKHNNRSAWDWIDSFIRHDCKKVSSCQHPLEYYCEILEEDYREDLESFFENRSFERAYKKDIEAETCGLRACQYGKVKDFKSFCEKI